MPRITSRPTTHERATIELALRREHLTQFARNRLNMVLEWADGKTLREVAADPGFKCSPETVRDAVAAYRKAGVAAFRSMDVKPRGKAPIPKEKRAAVEAAIRAAVEAGRTPNYRGLVGQFGLSLGSVGAIAKRVRGIDTVWRGPVAPKAPGKN